MTQISSSPEKAEKVDEFIRNENVLQTMERRQLKKQKSRLQATGEEEAPKLKYPPPPPPPPPAVVARLPTKTKTGMEGQGMMRPAMDLSEEIVRRRTTLREVRILLTALVC